MPRVYSKITEEERFSRFMDRVAMCPMSGCWIWTGARYTGGYGNFQRHTHAHRYSYERFKGPIPTGFHIDHKCFVRCCVNPDHLEAVTQRENNLRGNVVSAINKRKTHCPRGHELSDENNHESARKAGRRTCAICARANAERLRNIDRVAWREKHKIQERIRRAKRKENGKTSI